MIIWIASYPKSGNTWIRSLLSSYLFSEDGKFSFELLKKIQRFTVKNYLQIASDDSSYQSRIPKYWIRAQEIINKDKRIHLLKTHNAICTINGNRFTNRLNTLAAIYIARDPRNLITSIAHHYDLNMEEALEFITNKKKIIYPINTKIKKAIDDPEDFNFLGDWSSHYQSWKKINFCPIKIIRYEDFLADPNKTFISTLNFLSEFMKLKFDQKKIDKALASTSFNVLSKMEKDLGFEESSTSLNSKKKIKFFNLGKKNNWKILLDKHLIEKIETHFKNEMSELGYL